MASPVRRGHTQVSSSGSAVHNLVAFKNSQGTSARGTLLKLTRSTVVFEVYNPYSIVQLSEVLEELTLRRGDRPIYQGRAVVSNLVNTGLMLIVSVTLVDPWQDLTGLFEDGLRTRREVERFIHDWGNSYQIRPSYQLAVGELRSFFAEFSRWLEQVDIPARGDGSTATGTPRVNPGYIDELAEPVFPKASELFARFEYEAAQVSEDELIRHKAFAQRDLHPLILRSPFVYRSYQKPLGYAGDYEMVNMMLRDGHEGPTAYAQIINLMNLKIGAAQAHRNRIDILVDYLERTARSVQTAEQPACILNIACGPAAEIQRFVRDSELANRCRFTLLDFNQETLEYTRAQIEAAAGEGGREVDIEYVQESVHSLLKRAAGRQEINAPESFDLVYCAGLFDYLSDKVCSRLISLFYQWAKPHALILTTNVHTDNNARYWMEHLVEWYLVYRDEQQMLQLFPDRGTPRVYTDATGINVFFEIEKTG